MKPLRERKRIFARRAALAVACALGAGGCSLLSEYRLADREPIRNREGHVVGHKETLHDRGRGETLARISLYTPWRNLEGEIVGYEERTRGGSVIRDLHGNVIGGRWKDLRSRATNPHNEGIAVVFRPPVPRRSTESPEESRPTAALDVVKLAARL